MERYKALFKESYLVLYEGTFSTSKPSPEPGYKIAKGMGRDPENPKKIIRGWIKTKVKKTMAPKGKRSKSSYRISAKKAAKTRKRDVRGQKLAKKKLKKTLKAKKRAGM